ncbi:MAG: metallophosphoesterase, partial [Spongiibacter sp.]
EEKFELPFEPVDLPFYFVLGNHDNTGFFGGDGAGNATGEYQVDYHYRDAEHPDAPRASQRWKMPDRYYRFSEGEQDNGKPLVEFFGIDSSQVAGGFPDSDENYSYNNFGLAQAEWLKSSIETSQAKWKFVFAHHPYVSNGSHGNAGNYDGVPGFLLPVLAGERYKAFLEETMCDRADFMFAGHDHDLQWLMSQPDCGKTEFILSGAASKTRSLEGRNSNPVFYEKGDSYGFVWVEVKGDQFYGEVYEVDPDDGALGIGSLTDPQPAFIRSTLQQPAEGIASSDAFTSPLQANPEFDVYGEEGNLDEVQSTFAEGFTQLAGAVNDPTMAALINAMAQSSVGLIEVLDALSTGVQKAAEEQNPDLLMAGSARASQALLYSLQQLQAVVDSNESLPAPFDQLGGILDEFRASVPSADDQGSGEGSADLRSLTDPVKALAMNIQGLVDAIEEETGVVPVVGGSFALLSELLFDVGRTLDAVGNASTAELGQVLVSLVEDLLNNILVGIIPIEQFAPAEVTNAIGLGPKFLSSVLLAVVREVTFVLDNTLLALLAPLIGALDELLLTPLFDGLASLADFEF